MDDLDIVLGEVYHIVLTSLVFVHLPLGIDVLISGANQVLIALIASG